MSFENVRTVGIIGAGVSGISTAKMLLGEGFNCTVFERSGELGGVWADGYANFGVQVQKELYEFPDWPLPADTPNFTPGPIFQKYLAAYCNEFGVSPHIRLGTEVTRVSAREDGKDGWKITYREDGEEHETEFDLLVVCVGTFSNQPYLPEFPGQRQFEGKVIHNSAFKTRDQVAGRRVAVLGYGKSAADAALESAAVAAETSIIVRTSRWPVPRKLAGVLPFKWGMLHRMTSALLPLYQRSSGLEHTLHTLGAPLVWLYWRLTQVLLYFQCRLGSPFDSRTNLVPSMPIEIGAFDHTTMVVRPEFYGLVRNGKIGVRQTEIQEFTKTGVILQDGSRLDVDVMIFATGWRTDYAFFDDEILAKINIEDEGYYLYRHMVQPDLAGMIFLGCNATTYESILTYSLQARWLAELLKGKHGLPDRATMRREIEDMKAWKREWMPANHARGATIGLHQLHYHDELLRDFGANPKRKKGLFAPLKELIDPYEPNDYRIIVSGAWEQEEIHRV